MIKIFQQTICCIILIFTGLFSYGQEIEDSKNFFDTPQVLYKYNVTSLFEIEPTFQLGVEYIFKPRIGFQQQLGYIFQNPSTDIWGIRSRSEMKFYLNKTRRERPFYISTEILYKFVQNYGTRTFVRDGGSYTQRFNFRANRSVIGFTPKIGIMNNFTMRNFVFDLSFGLGVKAAYYSSNLPADADLLNSFAIWDFSNLSKSGNEVLQNVILSLQIGFTK